VAHGVYVQEHWLAPFSLIQLDTMCPNFQCFATSAMNDVVCNKLLVGRPFGGVAILVKQNLASDFKVVKLSTRYIILKAWSTLFINVYLPCISSTDWENEYLDCLACIANDVSEVGCRNVIMGGDFNIDFSSKHPLINVMCSFMTDLSLVNLDNKLPPGTNVSFRVDTSGASSLVDHFLCQSQLVIMYMQLRLWIMVLTYLIIVLSFLSYHYLCRSLLQEIVMENHAQAIDGIEET